MWTIQILPSNWLSYSLSIGAWSIEIWSGNSAKFKAPIMSCVLMLGPGA